jgi:glycosyltransferase involved in cell wall biosynthesis
VEAQIWLRHYQVSKNPLWRAVSWREYKAIARLERLYLGLADHVLTVSQKDLDIFSAYIPREKMTLVETGVDVDYFKPAPQHEKPHTLVFTGSMDWTPNEDGILWFVESVLPLVRKEIPNTQLVIVGRKPSRRIQELAKDPRIRVTGKVDDIRPYLAEASVYIVPLRIGGGTRIKIFEAMAAGKAVVSSGLGAEGLPVENRKNIVLVDEAKDFAREIVALERNPAEREKLGKSARRLVESKYSWASVATRFSEVLERVASNSSPQKP